MSIQSSLGGVLILFSAMLIHSCVDPMYDFKKGIDTQISVGGDSLAIPLGSTDTIRLSDFLSSDDLDFLKTMEDGGYGFSITDSLSVEDLLSSLDASKLKFEDQIFSQSSKISFGNIDIGDFKIPGFSKRDTLAMNIPTVDLGDIVPSVDLNTDFTVSFSDFALDPSTLQLADFFKNTGQDGLLANLLAANDVPVHPAFNFETTEPIKIEDEQGNDLEVTVEYKIDVPEGITNIYQIDLQAGAVLEITIQLENAEQSLEAGDFTPHITIDPGNLFLFDETILTMPGGKIVFGEPDKLTGIINPAYSRTKTYRIKSFHNLPSAIDEIIDISELVVIQGNIDAEGRVKANMAQTAKNINLKILVAIKDVTIKNMDFDVPAFTTTLNGSSEFLIDESGLPEQIGKINSIYFGKVAASTNATNLVINIIPSNLPDMKAPSYLITNLSIDFPNEFIFGNLAGRTYTVPDNTPFDPVNGLTIELDLDEINLSNVPIVNQSLNWTGSITYNGIISIGGRMDSEKIDTTKDPTVNLASQTAIRLDYASVQTNQIDEAIESSEISLELEIDIADQVARLGTINLKPGTTVRVNINPPTLPLTLQADNITLSFSDMFEFASNPNLINNEFIINGNIPDFIELELKSLHINKDLVDGRLTLIDKITIKGGVSLLSGNVNSTQIADLNDEKLIFQAVISDIFIESTSLDMKTLEATYNDFTELDLEIDEVPEQIVALDSILLKPGASIDMEITITNMPNLGANPLEANIIIQFPELLAFMPGEVNEKNEVVISKNFENGKLAHTLRLKGLQFDGSNLGGKLSIKDQLGFDVNVRVVDPSINSEELTNSEDISVAVKVTLAGLEFQSVYGKFDVDFGDQLDIPNIELADLPDFLKGDDVVLDIASPVISLYTESNIGIPVDAVLGLTKFKGGQLLTNDKLSLPFSLPKAPNAQTIMQRGYWFSPTDNGKPASYLFVPRDVQNLFKPVPDSLKIDLTPTINTGVQHYINLSDQYNLKVKYDIIIPFSFGKDFSIVIRDTLENLDLGLGDGGIEAGGLELLGTITNSIPLNLELELLLMDENFNILSSPSPQTIKAGAPDGSGVKSDISIKIVDNSDDLSKLNKVVLVFRATSNITVAGTPIRPENYIKAELKARVKGGVKVKL